jgi:AraC-like DNA-binding protein
MGTSFYDFINTYRVEKAKQLLTEGAYRNAKVIHIAYDSGFSHKSTFLRSFKKVTGHTPSEFRKKSKKEVSLH